MKKQFALYIFIIFSYVSVFAQTNIYQPYATDSVNQIIEHTVFSTNYYCTYRLGDTLINGNTYLKCHNSPSQYYGGLRQDIPNEKLFYIDLSNTEYDISISQHLNVNDTLRISAECFEAFGYWATNDDSVIISGIDSVLIGSSYHKKYNFNPCADGNIMFGDYICGVGFSLISGFEWGFSIFCYKVNNIKLYGVPGPCDCYFPNIINELNKNPEGVSLFPNPFSNYSNLQTQKPLQSATLIVYDILGKEIKRMENLNGKEIIIQREGIPDGMSFYSLFDKSGLLGNGKLVVE